MNILIALLGGILTFISPCVLPLIPVYLAYITGISFQELAGGDEKKENKKPFGRIFFSSLFFVLGFTIVFTALAALFYIFAQFLGQYKIWFDRAAGAVLILFGLNMMGVLKLNFLNMNVKYDKQIKRHSVFSSFFIGMAFGAGWTPCVGPIFSGILFTSAGSSNPATAVLLLVVYSLGLGIPFILTGIITNRLLSLFQKIKKHYRAVEIIGGLFLILMGLLLIVNGVGFLSDLFSGIFPDFINIEKNLVK